MISQEARLSRTPKYTFVLHRMSNNSATRKRSKGSLITFTTVGLVEMPFPTMIRQINSIIFPVDPQTGAVTGRHSSGMDCICYSQHYSKPYSQ